MSKENEYLNVQFIDMDSDEFLVRTVKCEMVMMSIPDLRYEIVCDGCVYKLSVLKYAFKTAMPFDKWCRYYGWLMQNHPKATEMYKPLNEDDFDEISSIDDRLKEELL